MDFYWMFIFISIWAKIHTHFAFRELCPGFFFFPFDSLKQSLFIPAKGETLHSLSVITVMIMSHFDLGQANEFPEWSHCGFDLHSPSSHKNKHNVICILAVCTALSEIVHSFPLLFIGFFFFTFLECLVDWKCSPGALPESSSEWSPSG